MARIWTFGTDVNTDQIVPGRFAPYMTSEDELRKYAFVEARPEFARDVRAGDVIVAGDNFGCGSSREYAALALKKCELGAILAPSFARIFFRNALNLGLPLIEIDARHLADGAEVTLDLERGVLVAEGATLELPLPSGFAREIWAAGGLIPYVLEHGGFPATSERAEVRA